LDPDAIAAMHLESMYAKFGWLEERKTPIWESAGALSGGSRVFVSLRLRRVECWPTNSVSPRPDLSDSWPDGGGAVRRVVGSMEASHAASTSRITGR
jgi:hypothetical protein